MKPVFGFYRAKYVVFSTKEKFEKWQDKNPFKARVRKEYIFRYKFKYKVKDMDAWVKENLDGEFNQDKTPEEKEMDDLLMAYRKRYCERENYIKVSQKY